MATARNDITNDLIATKGTSESYAENYEKNFPKSFGTVTDGFSIWEKCGKRCWLEVVRPGSVQCNKPNCPRKR